MLPAITKTKTNRLAITSRFTLAKLKYLYLTLTGMLVSFLLTSCTYGVEEASPPSGTITLPPVPVPGSGLEPHKTDFGAADFLVGGIADILNSLATVIGKIGTGVLGWFIQTSASLNLTRTGSYRTCQLSTDDATGFNLANPIDPLASCAIAVYDELKYLPGGLLGVLLVYFLVRSTFQGVFRAENRLSLTDYVSNIFLTVLVAFNLDFVITLVIDISSKLFILILTVGKPVATSSSSSNSLAGDAGLTTELNQSLTNLVKLFDIAPVHKEDLGLALVLVVMCIPAALALMLMGVFFFTRLIFFLLYFILGAVAVTARLAEETDFFFTAWYTGLVKLAISSLPLAVVLRLGLEVGKVLEVTTTPEPIQYIILLLIMTLLFGAGGYYAFSILKGEVRRGVATVSKFGSTVGKLAAASGIGSLTTRFSASASASPGSRGGSKTNNAGSGAVSRPGRGQSSSGTSLKASTGHAGSRSGDSSSVSSNSSTSSSNNLPLSPQMLTNAISTGLTQAFTSQNSKNERVAGAVLNKLSSMSVCLDEIRTGLAQMNQHLSRSGFSSGANGSMVRIVQAESVIYRGMSATSSPGSERIITIENAASGVGVASNPAQGQAGYSYLATGQSLRRHCLRRGKVKRSKQVASPTSASVPGNPAYSVQLQSQSLGLPTVPGTGVVPASLQRHSFAKGSLTQTKTQAKTKTGYQSRSAAFFGRQVISGSGSSSSSGIQRLKPAAKHRLHPQGQGNALLPQAQTQTYQAAPAPNPAVAQATASVDPLAPINLSPIPGHKRTWEPTVKLLLNPNTGQAYTGRTLASFRINTRLKPIRSVSPTKSKSTGY